MPEWSESAAIITSRSNARVKALRASLSGEAREPGDLLGLEGVKLVLEAHMAGYVFDTLYFRQGSEKVWQETWPTLRVQHRVVLARDVFDSTVTTRSPQGLAATCVIPKLEGVTSGPANTLVLERIQDPGNLGTLLRSAESFGMARVMVTPDTANQWGPKVMRAGAGSVLRMPVERAPIEELLSRLRAQGTRIFAAVAHFTGDLNIAAPHGVLTGRRPKFPQFEHGPTLSLSYDTDFEHPCAILIGNEGAGLSPEALAMADEQVLIPGAEITESLNAAVAGAILMYESMRQITLRIWARKQGLRP